MSIVSTLREKPMKRPRMHRRVCLQQRHEPRRIYDVTKFALGGALRQMGDPCDDLIYTFGLLCAFIEERLFLIEEARRNPLGFCIRDLDYGTSFVFRLWSPGGDNAAIL